MTVNKDAVFIGGPDITGGAVRFGPLGTVLPTDAVTAPNVALLDQGYISEDGIKVSPKAKWTEIMDWSGSVVRRSKESQTDTISFSFLEINPQSAKSSFGSTSVTSSVATALHGEQLAIKFTSGEANRGAWVISMLSGLGAMRVCVSDGQITDVGDLSFTKKGAAVIPVTLALLPDANGVTLVWHTDDGVKTVI